MKILNLSEGFDPFSDVASTDVIPYKSLIFSGGEPHIQILIDQIKESFEEVMITCRINSFADIGLLLVAVDALRRMDIKLIDVVIPYFPGARQDKFQEGESLTVKIYADIINSMKFNSVHILDPHSIVTPALVDNCKVGSTDGFIEDSINEIMKLELSKNPAFSGEFTIISPDAGALHKIEDSTRYLLDNTKHQNFDIVTCSKVRDQTTGKLSHFTVDSFDLMDKPCIIIDDICDGGGTFMGLAKELSALNAGNLYLIVTHGIFSKGFKDLSAIFEMIYTTNSIKEYDSKYIADHKYHLGFTPSIKQYEL